MSITATSAISTGHSDQRPQAKGRRAGKKTPGCSRGRGREGSFTSALKTSQATMVQGRQPAAHRLQFGDVQLGDGQARTVLRTFGQHAAPGADEHRMAPGAASVEMLATLRRGRHEGQV